MEQLGKNDEGMILNLTSKRFIGIIETLNEEDGGYLIRLLTHLSVKDSEDWAREIRCRSFWFRDVLRELDGHSTCSFHERGNIWIKRGYFNYALNMDDKQFYILRPFMSRFETIEEAVEGWHLETNFCEIGSKEIYEYLGFSKELYEKWVENPKVLNYE